MTEICSICNLPIEMMDLRYDRVWQRIDGSNKVHLYCVQMMIGLVPECPLYEDQNLCTNKCVRVICCVNHPKCNCRCEYEGCYIGKSSKILYKQLLLERFIQNDIPEYRLKCGEEQLSHQTWNDPDRLSLQIDCPPGIPRPEDVFQIIISDSALTENYFQDSGNTIFGCREYLVKPDTDSVTIYLKDRSKVGKRLDILKNIGIIRGYTR